MTFPHVMVWVFPLILSTLHQSFEIQFKKGKTSKHFLGKTIFADVQPNSLNPFKQNQVLKEKNRSKLRQKPKSYRTKSNCSTFHRPTSCCCCCCCCCNSMVRSVLVRQAGHELVEWLFFLSNQGFMLSKCFQNRCSRMRYPVQRLQVFNNVEDCKNSWDFFLTLRKASSTWTGYSVNNQRLRTQTP